MPNILFLIDTSGSMNQRTYYGTTFLDIAKVAIENFLKIRQKCNGITSDRFMLLTTEEFPKNIKVNWKDAQYLLNELKCLGAKGVTLLGDGFKTAFDMLNINRMISRIDNYGMGRNPWYLEPTLVLCLTDGHAFSSNKGPDIELTLPLSSVRGSELTSEPYRWDQRVFSLVLQIPALDEVLDSSNQPGVPASDNRALNDLCEVTGGRSYKITSMKVLNQCLESISQKILHGVVLKFLSNSSKAVLGGFSKPGKRENDMNGLPNGVEGEKQMFTNCQKMIIVKAPVKGQPNGQWPIPEPYFADRNMHELCARTSHPEVTVITHDVVDPLESDYISPDVYEIEACPMTHSILERSKSQSFAWPVFIAKSGPGEHGLGSPFGYVRAHPHGLRKVNLYVLPYNYPVLFPLLTELVRVHKAKPPTEWCKRFDQYISCIPLYYAVPMREALKKLGAGHLVPESLDYYQSHNIANYLKSLSQLSKQESDRIAALLGRQDRLPHNPPVNVMPHSAADVSLAKSQSNFHQLISSLTGETPTSNNGQGKGGMAKTSMDSSTPMAMTPLEPHAFAGFTIPNLDPKFKPDMFRNPFDTRRASLVDQVTKMRNNFSNLSFWGKPFYDMVDKHSILISAMGNYQDFVNNRVPPLRELDPTPARQHAFGNPYKLAGGDRDKMMIDETEDFDEHQVSASLSNQSSPSAGSGLGGSSLSAPGGKRQSPMSPVLYRPGKRIRPPSLPPSAFEGGSAAPITNGKSKLKSKDKKPGSLRAAFRNQERKERTANGGFRQPKSTTAAVLSQTEVDELKNGEALFDEEVWKKRTDDLVHAICRVIRYPSSEVDLTADSMCNNLTGPVNYQISVIKFLTSEAERFKRARVVDKLKQRINTLQKSTVATT